MFENVDTSEEYLFDDDVIINSVVMGSNTAFINIIKWYYTFDFNLNSSPGLLNEDISLFCFLSLVLVLRINNLSVIILWFWVPPKTLELFICCCAKS